MAMFGGNQYSAATHKKAWAELEFSKSGQHQVVLVGREIDPQTLPSFNEI